MLAIIYCYDIIIEPAQFKFELLEQQKESINLTWSQESSPMIDKPQNFLLTIKHDSDSQVISLNDSSYYFTAPEGAPPCEIYNFSVTAPYNIVGANYTVAGCSVSSPVLSRMLPSLPDIDEVESTLSYSLTKEPNGGWMLQVLFTVSN